jgi:hypothetical protein
MCEGIYVQSLVDYPGTDAQQSEEIAAAFMGALFGVVHDTIMDAKCSSDKHKEAFDKSWGISDVAHQANAPRIKNFEKVRTNAITLLKEHAEEILDARRFSAPMVFIEPGLEEPGGESELMCSRVTVFNEWFRDCLLGNTALPYPRHQIRRGSGRRPARTRIVVLHVHV